MAAVMEPAPPRIIREHGCTVSQLEDLAELRRLVLTDVTGTYAADSHEQPNDALLLRFLRVFLLLS